MTKIIAFANQKGGVAKTTSAIALAQTLAMEGKRILFLDLDPQENASNTLRVNHMPTLYDLMKARKPDDETLKKSFCQLEDNKNITAIRGDIRLASADMEFVFTGREFIIRDILRRCCDPYDVVIMDTPPNLGILTVNALSAAHTVVIPVSPDGYSLQGFMQLMFCDLSTPHGDGKFNVYNDLKAKLIRMGVPEAEIAFIHDAKTEAQKAALFTNVRAGNVRILLGSTAKMGAGTNVQKRLIAEHHLDIPWRPSDIEQREGRILRQGNENKRVDIFRYVTENTFDSYMWQTIENKQKFISQIMTSKSPVRSCEDVDETALSYAEIKALATGNPHIKEKMDLEIEVSRLKLVKANYLSQKYALEDSLLKHYPKEIRLTQERIKGYQADIALYQRHKTEEFPGMVLCGISYSEKKDAGAAIIEICKAQTSPEAKEIGSYRGFALLLSFDTMSKVFRMTLRGSLSHTIELGSDIHGNIQRMENILEAFPVRLSACEKVLVTLKEQMENAKSEVEKPFAQEQELSEKTARLAELDALLNIDKRENDVLDAEPEHQDERTQAKEEIER